VALKTIIPDGAATEVDRRRFLREAEILKQLVHPYIVSYRDMGDSSGQLYFAMDFVQGTDAAKLLRSQYPSGMPKADVTEIISAVADALDHPLKLLRIAISGVRTDGPMAPEIALDGQRPAEFVFSRHVESKLAEIDAGEVRAKQRASAR